MRWDDERFVKLYTRDTLTWKRLGWEGRAIFPQLLRKVDRAGILVVDDLEPAIALAVILDAPEEVTRAAWDKMLPAGVVEFRPERREILIPNFLAAQDAIQSDKARQAKHRELARSGESVTKRDIGSQNVTNSHAVSRGVTDGHAMSRAVTTRLEETRPEETRSDQKPPAAEKPAAPVRKRPVASPEEQACRKALRDAFEQAFTQHSQGKVYLWNAADQTGIKTICNAVGNQAPAALEILAEYKRRMASDPFMAANLSPRFIASRLNVLRVPIVASTPIRPGMRDLRFGTVPAATAEQCAEIPQGRNRM